MHITIKMLALLFLAIPTLAPALPPYHDYVTPRVKSGVAIGINAAYLSYSMHDLHEFLKQITVNTSTPSLTAGSEFGVQITNDLTEYIRLGAELNYLTAAITVIDPSGANQLAFNLPIIWLGPHASFAIANLTPNTRLSAEMGLGLLWLASANIISTNLVTGTSNTTAVSGYGRGISVALGVSHTFESRFELFADLGYQFAVVPIMQYQTNGRLTELTKADNTPVSLDYTGMRAKAGLRYVFDINPKVKPQVEPVAAPQL